MPIIISNNDGKIIRTNTEGKIMKQNYVFGNSFIKHTNTYSLFIDNLASSLNNATVLLWCDFSVVSSNNSWLNLEFSTPTAYSTSLALGRRVGEIRLMSGSTTPIYAGMSQRFFAFMFDRENNLFWMRNNNTVYGKLSMTANNLNNPLQRIRLGEGYNDNSIAQATAGVKFDEVRIYNRILSNVELSYIYNNGNGNDDFNEVGLVSKLHFTNADILDFSVLQNGSDMRVGAMDFSGNNNHAYFNALPAGTLIEKRDWANANLFTQFI